MFKRTKNSIKSIVESFLSSKEAEQFSAWAFGKNYAECLESKLWVYWNNLHGDKFKIKGDSNPHNDIPKMIELWKAHKLQNRP